MEESVTKSNPQQVLRTWIPGQATPRCGSAQFYRLAVITQVGLQLGSFVWFGARGTGHFCSFPPRAEVLGNRREGEGIGPRPPQDEKSVVQSTAEHMATLSPCEGQQDRCTR